MNTLSPGDPLKNAAREPVSVRPRGPLSLWYRLTAPPLPPDDASLEQRQRAARGQLTSETLLLVIILVLAAEPVAFLGTNRVLAIILLIPICIDLIGLVFNRLGRITVAGILVIAGIEVGILLSILGPSLGGGGLSTYTLPQYDLLVQATLVAVTLLPPRSVFLIVLFHIALTIGSILFLPHAPEFTAVLAANEYDMFLRPITLQVIVAFVTYRWVTNADHAIRRADRAEEIASIERREMERQAEEIELKQQLEQGVQQVLSTLNEAANGHFEARTRIARENILFRVGYAVNTLLARLQSLHTERIELEKTRQIANQIAMALRDKKPLPFTEWTGTSLDPVIMQLQAQRPSASQQQQSSLQRATSSYRKDGRNEPI